MQPKHIIEYISLRLFCSFIKCLPEKAAFKVGRRIGILSTFFLKSRIQLAHDNLKLAYHGELTFKQRKELINKLFLMLGEAVVESIIFKNSDIEKNILIDGFENLDNALKKDKGVILIGPHLGMWELASYFFGSKLKNASTIYKPLKNPLVNNYIIKNREKIAHLDLIPSKNGLRLVIKKLRKGLMIVMLYDQNAGRNGLPAKFFGKTAYTYSAPAVFAQKTGCAVVPAYITKEPGFRKHRIIIDKPIPLIDTGDKEKDLMLNTQQYNDFLETIVRKYPDQWFGWIHRRWRAPRTKTRARNPQDT